MKLHLNKVPSQEVPDRPVTLRESVLKDLDQIRYQLENAYLGFDYVTDPDLIDSYIFEVNALQMRYKYLLSLISSMDEVPSEDAVIRDNVPNQLAAVPALITSPS